MVGGICLGAPSVVENGIKHLLFQTIRAEVIYCQPQSREAVISTLEKKCKKVLLADGCNIFMRCAGGDKDTVAFYLEKTCLVNDCSH